MLCGVDLFVQERERERRGKGAREGGAATTAASASGATKSAMAAEVPDGPVMSMMSKRLRALRKKYNKILQMEESLAQGRFLNREQEEALRSKPAVAAIIEEYEKLRQPLAAALQEELSLAHPSPTSPEPEGEQGEGQLQQQQQQPPQPQGEGAVTATGEVEKSRPEVRGDPYADVEDLLKLLYFGYLFDMRPQSEFASMLFTRAHERQCCLTYDYVTDDSIGFLQEDDLDLISSLGGLMTTRPPHSRVSHKNALLGCFEHAKLWLRNSDQPIQPVSSITYAGLRERLNRILASDYFTRTPEMKAPADVAAAMEKFTACQVQLSGAAEPSSPALAEDPPSHCEDEADNVENSEGNDATSYLDNDSVKDESDLPNTNGDTKFFQQEQHSPVDGEARQKDADLREQQHVPGSAYQNQRGGGRGGGGNGGRRGYANGRGSRGRGGGYQNGRSQYHDSGYYPRNYYGTGRGGRNGGSEMYSHVGAADGEHLPANVELGSS